MSNKRDFREEVLLNEAEFIQLRWVADQKDVSKSAALRLALKLLAKQCIREQQVLESGDYT